MNQYEVTLRTGSDATGEWDVEADCFREVKSELPDGAPWLIFYKKTEGEIQLGERRLPTAASAGTNEPVTGTIETEVFRAPLHAVVAVNVDNDEDEDDEE